MKKTKTKRKNNVNRIINKIYKVGGSFQCKTLRRSKEKIHPRKLVLSLQIPVVATQDELLNLPFVAELKEKSIYQGCITEIKQTSPKYSVLTFTFILKNIKHLDFFINLLCNLAFNTKKRIEEVLGH